MSIPQEHAKGESRHITLRTARDHVFWVVVWHLAEGLGKSRNICLNKGGNHSSGSFPMIYFTNGTQWPEEMLTSSYSATSNASTSVYFTFSCLSHFVLNLTWTTCRWSWKNISHHPWRKVFCWQTASWISLRIKPHTQMQQGSPLLSCSLSCKTDTSKPPTSPPKKKMHDTELTNRHL